MGMLAYSDNGSQYVHKVRHTILDQF